MNLKMSKHLQVRKTLRASLVTTSRDHITGRSYSYGMVVITWTPYEKNDGLYQQYFHEYVLCYSRKFTFLE